jgi:hypothetical protein
MLSLASSFHNRSYSLAIHFVSQKSRDYPGDAQAPSPTMIATVKSLLFSGKLIGRSGVFSLLKRLLGTISHALFCFKSSLVIYATNLKHVKFYFKKLQDYR